MKKEHLTAIKWEEKNEKLSKYDKFFGRLISLKAFLIYITEISARENYLLAT